MNSLIRSLVPEALITLRRLKRASRIHEAQRQIWQNVRQELLDGAELLADRVVLLDRLPKNAVVAEIGAAEGTFSQEIMNHAKPSKFHIIDPWDSSIPKYPDATIEKIRSKFSNEIEAGIIQLHRGLSCDVLATFEENTFDWVYIDAAHDYNNVRDDLAAVRRTVKPGGLICGHDYLRWVSPTERYGVLEAVNEFVNATNSPFVFLTNQFDKHDSFGIRLNK